MKPNREKEEKDRVQSISTNGSFTPADEGPLVSEQNEKKEKGKSSLILSSKIENSKKRCQEVIDRFRKMNCK